MKTEIKTGKLINEIICEPVGAESISAREYTPTLVKFTGGYAERVRLESVPTVKFIYKSLHLIKILMTFSLFASNSSFARSNSFRLYM